MAESGRAHAELGASSAHRWMNCPGSIWLIRTLPFVPPASSYAREGTAMHAAAEQWLTSQKEPDWDTEEFEGLKLAGDAIEAVRFYVDFLRQERVEHGGSLLVERKFDLEHLRAGMFGRNDATLVLCHDKILRTIDFKGGKGVAVEVERNPQLMYYGLGALLKYADTYEIEGVELIIVQPRARHSDGPVRRWRVDLIDMHDWTQDLLDAAARTDDPNAPLVPGDWCRWCPAAGRCPSYRDHASDLIGFDVITPDPAPLPDPKAMTNKEIATLLPRLTVAEAWIRLVREHAHAEAEAGREIPGYKLVPKRGRRQWTAEEKAIIDKLIRLGVKQGDAYKQELRSPAQIEKLLPKAERQELQSLYATISSGNTLVPLDDSRTPVDGIGAAVFDALPSND